MPMMEAGEKSKALEQLYSYHLLKDEVFTDLDSEVTREDFVYLMVNVCELIDDVYILPPTAIAFRDTNDVYVQKAAYIGLTNGVGNGYFNPMKSITREQMATYFVKIWRMYDLELSEVEAHLFKDDEFISEWASASVYSAFEEGIMTVTSDNRFEPKKIVTREEALIFTYNMVQLYIIENSEQENIINRRLTSILDNQQYYPEAIPQESYRESTFVAHGGGEIYDLTVTNTFEAINYALEKGALLIEIDFLKTRDGHYVLSHDWSMVYKYFNVPYGVTTLDKFMKSSPKYPFTQMALDDLIYMFERNPNFKVITDTKDDNMAFLSYISRRYPNYLDRFIPQIYDMDNYVKVKELGFEDIIYSLYKIYKTDWEVIQFARNHELFGVTMAESRVNQAFCNSLSQYNTRTYVHTVNDEDLMQFYKEKGITGFYTDRLY